MREAVDVVAFLCRYVHAECDESLDLGKIEQEDYVCLACKNRDSTGVSVVLLDDAGF